MVRGGLSNGACPAACNPGERGSASDHSSGEDGARNCPCSLADANTSRWRPHCATGAPRSFDRPMVRCRLGSAPLFCAVRRIFRRRTCRLCPSRLPGTRSCAPRSTIAGVEGVRTLTSDFSSRQSSRQRWLLHCENATGRMTGLGQGETKLSCASRLTLFPQQLTEWCTAAIRRSVPKAEVRDAGVTAVASAV